MPKKTGRCHFCEEEVSADFYCYGCAAFVCDNCRVEHPSGSHEVEDHAYNEAHP